MYHQGNGYRRAWVAYQFYVSLQTPSLGDYLKASQLSRFEESSSEEDITLTCNLLSEYSKRGLCLHQLSFLFHGQQWPSIVLGSASTNRSIQKNGTVVRQRVFNLFQYLLFSESVEECRITESNSLEIVEVPVQFPEEDNSQCERFCNLLCQLEGKQSQIFKHPYLHFLEVSSLSVERKRTFSAWICLPTELQTHTLLSEWLALPTHCRWFALAVVISCKSAPLYPFELESVVRYFEVMQRSTEDLKATIPKSKRPKFSGRIHNNHLSIEMALAMIHRVHQLLGLFEEEGVYKWLCPTVLLKLHSESGLPPLESELFSFVESNCEPKSAPVKKPKRKSPAVQPAPAPVSLNKFANRFTFLSVE